VERLRILGIRAEPPEADPFSEVTLTALTVDPAGEGRPLTCTWAVCLVDLGPAAADIECPGGDNYFFGSDCATATLRMPELVAWLAERGLDIQDLPDDLPIQDLPLFVGFEIDAGADRTRGIKRITVGLTPAEDPNVNPVLSDLEVDGMAVGDRVLSLPADAEVKVRPVSDETTRQTFRREGEDQDQVEDFLFSWFSTGGEFADRRTILDVDSRGNPLDVNRFRLPAEPGPVSVWVVVRDGRYGIDWKEHRFEVAPAP
jgi:hypothetical protein